MSEENTTKGKEYKHSGHINILMHKIAISPISKVQNMSVSNNTYTLRTTKETFMGRYYINLHSVRQNAPVLLYSEKWLTGQCLTTYLDWVVHDFSSFMLMVS